MLNQSQHWGKPYRSKMGRMKFEVIADLEAFYNLKEEWDSLYRAVYPNNLFLTHQWLSIWIRHFGNSRWAAILCRSKKTNSLKAAAIFRIKGRKVGFIEPYHSHFPDILCFHGHFPLSDIITFLKVRYRPRLVELVQYPAKLIIQQMIDSSVGREWYVLKKSPYVMRSIDVSQGFESYLGQKKKKIRHELKRKNKKMEKAGAINISCLQSPAASEKLFNAIEEIEKDSWKYASGTAIISSDVEYRFYKTLFDTYSKLSMAKGYILFKDNSPLSYVMGIIHEGTFYALKTSYKEKYKQLSPGLVLFFRIIQAFTMHNEISTIELLGGDARWKEELATGGSSYCTYALYPKGICSLLTVLAYRYGMPIKRRLRKT